MPKTYAIVGGGTSGMTALGQLVNRLISAKTSLNEEIKIVIYEKDQANIATGIPYNVNASHVFLLNGPAAKRFKLLPDGKTLEQWMHENYEIWKEKFPEINSNDQFPPRALVGLYFKQQYEDIKKLAKEHGICIEEKIEEVINVEPTQENNYAVITKKDKLEVNQAILCFGHLPSDNFTDLKGCKNFINSPYAVDELKKIPANETVYVIGGHLAFIDAAKELVLTNNFQGKIVSVTRNPSLVTLRDHEDKCDHTAVDNLEKELKTHAQNSVSFPQFQSLFWEAYKKSSNNPVQKSFLERNSISKQILSYQLAKHSKQIANEQDGNFDHLRDFMEKFCIGNCYSALWNVLDENGKQEFSKYFYSLMVAFVAGTPPINARFLVEMYEQNRIEEKSGLLSISYDNETELFTLKFNNGTETTAKHIINATGTSRNINKWTAELPLIKNLIENGIIKASPWSGFEVNNKHAKNILAINPNKNYFEGKPGLSAVFLACHAAQEWLEKSIHVDEQALKPSCF